MNRVDFYDFSLLWVFFRAFLVSQNFIYNFPQFYAYKRMFTTSRNGFRVL